MTETIEFDNDWAKEVTLQRLAKDFRGLAQVMEQFVKKGSLTAQDLNKFARQNRGGGGSGGSDEDRVKKGFLSKLGVAGKSVKDHSLKMSRVMQRAMSDHGSAAGLMTGSARALSETFDYLGSAAENLGQKKGFLGKTLNMVNKALKVKAALLTGVVSVLTIFGDMLKGYIDLLQSTFNTGVRVNMSLSELRDAQYDLAMTTSQLSEVMAANALAVNRFGMGAIRNLAGAVEGSTRDISRLGMSSAEAAEYAARYMEIQRLGSARTQIDEAITRQRFLDNMANLNAISAITGRTRRELQEAERARQARADLQTIMLNMSAEQQEQMQAMLRIGEAMGMDDIMIQMLTSMAPEQAFAELGASLGIGAEAFDEMVQMVRGIRVGDLQLDGNGIQARIVEIFANLSNQSNAEILSLLARDDSMAQLGAFITQARLIQEQAGGDLRAYFSGMAARANKDLEAAQELDNSMQRLRIAFDNMIAGFVRGFLGTGEGGDFSEGMMQFGERIGQFARLLQGWSINLEGMGEDLRTNYDALWNHIKGVWAGSADEDGSVWNQFKNTVKTLMEDLLDWASFGNRFAEGMWDFLKEKISLRTWATNRLKTHVFGDSDGPMDWSWNPALTSTRLAGRAWRWLGSGQDDERPRTNNRNWGVSGDLSPMPQSSSRTPASLPARDVPRVNVVPDEGPTVPEADENRESNESNTVGNLNTEELLTQLVEINRQSANSSERMARTMRALVDATSTS